MVGAFFFVPLKDGTPPTFESMAKKRIIWGALLGGLALGIVLMMAFFGVDTHTSTNDSCMSCHYHEEADRL